MPRGFAGFASAGAVVAGHRARVAADSLPAELDVAAMNLNPFLDFLQHSAVSEFISKGNHLDRRGVLVVHIPASCCC